MNLKEAASLLGWKRELVALAIAEGVETPRTKVKVKLVAEQQGSDFDIPDEELDRFLTIFENEEPGRNPPVAVRRELLVECGYQCAVCESDAPLRFHHILDWANLKHHDPKHMLAVCGSCHDKIGAGQIDIKGQRLAKAKLTEISAKLKKLEESVDRTPPQNVNEWPGVVSEFIKRNVEFAAIYNPSNDSGSEYILPVANGCLVEEGYVLTCSEALKLADKVAEYKGGKVVILLGLAEYYFQVETKDEATGLVLCKITGRNEQRWKEMLKTFEEEGVVKDVNSWLLPPIKEPAKWKISP